MGKNREKTWGQTDEKHGDKRDVPRLSPPDLGITKANPSHRCGRTGFSVVFFQKKLVNVPSVPKSPCSGFRAGGLKAGVSWSGFYPLRLLANSRQNLPNLFHIGLGRAHDDLQSARRPAIPMRGLDIVCSGAVRLGVQARNRLTINRECPL